MVQDAVERRSGEEGMDAKYSWATTGGRSTPFYFHPRGIWATLAAHCALNGIKKVKTFIS